MAEQKFSFQKQILPHLLAVLAFIVITFIYFNPLFSGKTLAQHDSIQAKAAAQEANDHYKKTGKITQWTNSMFGGMPAYLIKADYPNSWTTKAGRFFVGMFPEPANLVILYLLGFYVLLASLRINPWLGVLGAIGFAFCSYNFINIEAGHVSKAIAIAFIPPMLAGALLAFQGKYLLGGAMFGLFLGLNLFGNHVQITYYFFLSMALLGIFQVIQAIREKTFKNLILATLALAVGGVLGAGSHASRLLTTSEYALYSIRGKSELSPRKDASPEAHSAEGLDKNYAFSYSYGISETFTLLIPNFHGGSSSGKLGEKSAVFQALLNNGQERTQAKQIISQPLPLYWGDLPFTGGPAYAGAIMLFLFVLGMFIVKNPVKWWLLASVVLMLMIAWGNNLAFFNYFMFDYLPLFNKFRAVTMTLTLVQTYIALMAVLAIHELTSRKITWAEFKNPLFISFGIVGGLSLIFSVMPGIFFDFASQSDKQMPEWIITAIQEDRASLLQGDAFRSLFFITVVAALLWAFVADK
ncbi:MAG: hypothetical protein H7Y04_02155, partial [Verrucomicrobia bacterium]|nr:hypothetical protein [Cytophagales bacterium]